jgi:hypothetical protein
MMHVGLGRVHPLHVEYVHLGACLSFIQDTMTEAILSHPKLEMRRKIALVKALGKVIWIQNDLMARWHVRDGDEFFDPADEDAAAAAVGDGEGFLHGKRVLDGVDEAGEEAEGGAKKKTTAGGTLSPPPPGHGALDGVCPFTGLARGVKVVRLDDDKRVPA